MEPKTEVIHYRLSPRYKKYLTMLAERSGRSLSGYITDQIRINTRIMIQHMASGNALADAIVETDLPQFKKLPITIKRVIMTPADIKEFLSEEDYQKLLTSFNKFYPSTFEKIKTELEYNDDAETDEVFDE